MTFPDIASGLPVAGMMLSLQTSSASGQAIVAVLFVGSILTWSFMIVKWRELGEAGRASQRFIDEYRRAAHDSCAFDTLSLCRRVGCRAVWMVWRPLAVKKAVQN